MIELINVSKQYRGVSFNKDSGVYLWIKNFASLTGNRAAPLLALNNVSFTAAPGEILGIYGENGAGKTTLIKILSGLLYPSGGEVRIDGRSDIRYIKSRVSYISTNGWMGLEWQLSVLENLILYGSLFGLPAKFLKIKSAQVLEAVGMTAEKDKYISQLSAGMRQKVTIARGLVIDRPIVFYDEPSVSLDVPSAKNLRELIKSGAADSRTAIIASHNPEDLSICGRIIFLSKGKIIAAGTKDELGSPFAGQRIYEVSYAEQGTDLNPVLPGIIRADRVKSAGPGSEEGEREVQVIKFFVRENEFSLNELVQYFIRKNITVRSIKPADFTLREMYEHYLGQKDDMNAA
ncbi:MAG: ABC transporter ATP-binding protein [Treponema sp.]|nr:ABC transporter ATP-binding protein [Treponema sp.]